MSSTEEEQLKYLEDCMKEVQKHAFYMKRATDGDSLKLALEHATEMLRELRTGLLTPKHYYELYMKVLDELRHLEEYLLLLHKSGRSLVEIYEQVQCSANIVPRLYLLCCVGGVYITSKEAPAKDVLKDLIEMIKGVQHPMRGLFLRNYLLLISKGRLPDSGSVYEGIGGNVKDAVSFLLQNLVESNRLWVRLQTQGGAKEKKKREKERLDLRVLVGANLVRLSQLEGMDVHEYKENILPKILEEMLSCKDTIAQSYLMDCIIQVFPDEFHLQTLEQLLKACAQLKEKVNVRQIFENLMNRLSQYVSNNSGNSSSGGGVTMPSDVNAFKLFNDCIAALIEDRANMSLLETLKLQTVLTNFALKCYPHRIDYVAHCLASSNALIAKSDYVNQSNANNTDSNKANDETTTQIELLLSAPLSTLSLKVLDIPAYAKLMAYLHYNNWREVAINLIKSVIQNNSSLSEVNQVEQLFKMIQPLVKDNNSNSGNTASDEKEDNSNLLNTLSTQFKEEQYLVARIVHLMRNDDTDVLLQLYNLARAQFTLGGAKRMFFTYPSLIFSAILLTRKVFEREANVEKGSAEVPQFSTRKIFHFIIEAITALATYHPELSMKLFLHAAQAADDCGFHAIAYEFIKEAFLLYECEITDSRNQVNALTAFVGTLLNCKSFPNEDYEALITKVAQYSNKLLKKSDQCRMVSMSALLFFPPKFTVSSANAGETVERYSDCDRVLECMQRSLKIASTSNPNLFVEILDRYLYFFENDNPIIQPKYISGLIALINENFASEGNNIPAATKAHYQNTLAYIRSRMEAEESAEKFANIQL